MGKGSRKPPTEPEITGLEPDQIASSQEAVPVAYFAGVRKFSVTWISKTYHQFTRPAPEERPVKK